MNARLWSRALLALTLLGPASACRAQDDTPKPPVGEPSERVDQPPVVHSRRRAPSVTRPPAASHQPSRGLRRVPAISLAIGTAMTATSPYASIAPDQRCCSFMVILLVICAE